MTIIKTTEEIVARINEITDDDFLGKRNECLVLSLDFATAAENGSTAPGATAEDWPGPIDPVDAARAYLDFAIEKIEGQRGISAGRSTDAFGEWVWLHAGDEAFEDYVNVEYASYGAPQIRHACTVLGLTAEFDAALAGSPELQLALDGRYNG
jgi:hypothetical protein